MLCFGHLCPQYNACAQGRVYPAGRECVAVFIILCGNCAKPMNKSLFFMLSVLGIQEDWLSETRSSTLRVMVILTPSSPNGSPKTSSPLTV